MTSEYFSNVLREKCSIATTDLERRDCTRIARNYMYPLMFVLRDCAGENDVCVNTREKREGLFWPAFKIAYYWKLPSASKNPIFSFNYVAGRIPVKKLQNLCNYLRSNTCSGRRCLSTSLINAITYSSAAKGLLSPLKMYSSQDCVFSPLCFNFAPNPHNVLFYRAEGLQFNYYYKVEQKARGYECVLLQLHVVTCEKEVIATIDRLKLQ